MGALVYARSNGASRRTIEQLGVSEEFTLLEGREFVFGVGVKLVGWRAGSGLPSSRLLLHGWFALFTCLSVLSLLTLAWSGSGAFLRLLLFLTGGKSTMCTEI